MTTVKCRECGKDVSGYAETCPECGGPVHGVDAVGVQGAGEGGGGAAVQPKTAGKAIASLICSLVGFFICLFVFHVLGIVLACLAKKDIRESGGRLKGDSVATAGLVLGIVGIVYVFMVAILAAMLMPALSRARHEALKASCAGNLNQIGLSLAMYEHHHGGRLPTGATSGEVFRQLVEGGHLDATRLLSCPGNPVADIDFDDPKGIGYYIDPGMPQQRHPQRAIAADRPPWDVNHGDGVNVLFEDRHVRFVRARDSGPPDKISNPYLPEDTDIFADTGDPSRHAWIRWEREPQ